MYAPYFGLSRDPFSLAPDPRFLFMSERHREALAHLLYGVKGGGGFVLLTGEIGAGKTTVTRCFLQQLPPQCVVAYIFNPCLTVMELLQTVCGEFGIPALPAEASVRAHVDALNTFLLQAHAEGRHALLVIDEAQALEPALLEQLRLLTNLETSERKLLQIMLIGQPELRDMLDSPGMEQLAQRVIARYNLGQLTVAETRQYVNHRLQVAGLKTPPPFEPRALTRLHKLTGGVPRRINLLADRALLGAYGRRLRSVDVAMVVKAAQEVFDPRGRVARQRRERLAALAAAGALVAGVVIVGVWAWQHAAAPSSGPVLAALPRGAPAAATSPPGPVAGVAAGTAGAGAMAPSDPPASAPPAVSAPTVALPAPSDDPSALMAAAPMREDLAWRELALRWNVAIGEGEPCAVAPQAQLACYRSASGGLPLLRQLGRPAVLALRGDVGPQVHAVLVGLDDTRATLQVGRQRFDLSLPALASVWRGEFSTFWRTPPGWRTGAELNPPPSVRAWIEQRLPGAAVEPASSAEAGLRPLRERVASFQQSHGLQPDSRPGPVTLMHLNRLTGVDEPRLTDTTGR